MFIFFIIIALPEKIEETARYSKSNKAAEPIAEWKEDVVSTVVSLLLFINNPSSLIIYPLIFSGEA
jgi:hypothetical protein